MLSIDKVKDQFEYVEDNEQGDIYAGIYSFESSDAELFINSVDKNVEQIQVDNFNWLIENQNTVKMEATKFIANDVRKKGHKDINKILNGSFMIDIVTVLGTTEDFDIEVICSMNYKALFSNKRIDYVIAIKQKEILEIVPV